MYYNESYEDYIRSILGYPNYNNNTCENNYQIMQTSDFRNNERDRKLEGCYPEIYKVVYPMVNKACSNNTKAITPDLVDELTEEIYLAIENDNTINININLTNEVQTTENRNVSNHVKHVKKEEEKETRRENRQFRNKGLQDLIRILLIRELLGRPGGGAENHQPMPPQRPPMRPPFLGSTGTRPPIMPRYSNDFANLYEV